MRVAPQIPRLLSLAYACSIATVGRVLSASTPANSSTTNVTSRRFGHLLGNSSPVDELHLGQHQHIHPLFRRNHSPVQLSLHTHENSKRAVDILQQYLLNPPNTSQNETVQFKPIVLCGPSGVGKSYLIRQLAKAQPNLVMQTVSHTTRAPRGTEQNGKEYHFVSRDTFVDMIRSGKFVEYDEIHGNYYGTSFDAIRSVHGQNRTCVMDLTIAGASQLLEACSAWQNGLGIPTPWIFYVRPPSLEELEKWLRSRKTESEESLQRRLSQAETELKLVDEIDLFDAVITRQWEE